ncbi:MAG: endonuclease/exonuclease/phosphatase family protein [Myxococcota bacterium]|jgi:endonuclease/exonuclease/phosphatase family metal-dependent hydrolase|nr:endonuclease/exonuclease/phosphatase family protein [Myxococcota bacterium]
MIIRAMPVLLLLTLSWTSARTEELTVLSYNINYGNVDLDETCRLIREADADLVALQEVTPAAEEHLSECLAEHYAHQAFQSGQAATGFGFLSRWPLEDVRYHPPEHGWFGSFLARIQFNDESLELANVHLLPTIPERGEGALRLLGRYMQLESTRIKEVESLLAAMPSEGLRLVMGDFNTIPGMGSLQLLEASGLVDAATAHGGERANTWSWSLDGWTVSLCLDYIFADQRWRVDAFKVSAEGPSDHYPVVARLFLQSAPTH